MLLPTVSRIPNSESTFFNLPIYCFDKKKKLYSSNFFKNLRNYEVQNSRNSWNHSVKVSTYIARIHQIRQFHELCDYQSTNFFNENEWCYLHLTTEFLKNSEIRSYRKFVKPSDEFDSNKKSISGMEQNKLQKEMQYLLTP